MQSPFFGMKITVIITPVRGLQSILRVIRKREDSQRNCESTTSLTIIRLSQRRQIGHSSGQAIRSEKTRLLKKGRCTALSERQDSAHSNVSGERPSVGISLRVLNGAAMRLAATSISRR